MNTDLVWHTETRKIKDLKDHPKNPRQITKEQMEKIKESLGDFNYVEVVAINLDNTIIAGHMRTKAMKALGRGKEEIEVRVPSRMLTDKEAERYLIISNKSTGSWDYDILSTHWDAEELLDFGFNEQELHIQEVEEIEPIDEDEVDLDPPVISKTKLGDVYELGRHRLICGSSTENSVRENLFLKETCDLVITDPPYNVAYTGKTKDALTIKNDSMDNDSFYKFLYDAYVNMFISCKEGASIYVFHADIEGINFRKAFKESGFKLSECLMWVKNCMVLGRQDYHWKHEPILYGWKEGAAHNWYSDRSQTTVLEFNKPSRNAEHPTMKPLDILCYLIGNSSKKGDIVFDPFLGSGSTMMACEQTNRICYGIELDPKYCDVIVNRYIKHKQKQNESCVIKLNGEDYAQTS